MPGTATPSESSPTKGGAFAPMRERLFAVLWVATLLGNIGSFARDTANAWIMTGLSPSPLAVALVQSAATLPVFLLAIPAGVLADLLDRRRLLIAAQIGLTLVSAILMLLAWTHSLNVVSLIALTLCGGVGTALIGPAWQAIVPQLVARPLLRDAVALNSLGVNVARSIGPAAGGLLLALAGPAVTYGVDVLSYLFVIAALWWWPHRKAAPDPLAERFSGAFRAGWRYALASDELQRVLLRAVVFFAFASAAWSLLPLVAQRLLHGSASLYGAMLGLIGAGAIGGALLLPRLRRRLGADGLALGAALLVAGVLAGLSLQPPQAVALVLMLVLGLGWIAALSTFNALVQAILPDWVRGRGLAIYLTTFSGAMSAGSLAWGLLAEALPLTATLQLAAAGLAVAALLLRRRPLPAGEADLRPVAAWPEPPPVAGTDHDDRGPVLVQVRYQVRDADREAFLAALQPLARARRRSGATDWGVAEDATKPGELVEWFLLASWNEHLRQHQRVSQPDADVQAAAARFHIGETPPQVQHLVGLRAVRRPGV